VNVKRVEEDLSKLSLEKREKSSIGFEFREPDRTILQKRTTMRVERGTGMPSFGTKLSSPGTLINPTISKDNTKGEQARQRALLAEFGSKNSRRDPELVLISQRLNGPRLPSSKPTTSTSNIRMLTPITKSKWASDEYIGQDYLYDAVEKVLNELKAASNYSTPFLRPVSRKETPDYYDSKSSFVI
jgi:hypothetical protein